MGHTADSRYPDREKVDKNTHLLSKSMQKKAGTASKDSTLKSSNAVNAKLAILLFLRAYQMSLLNVHHSFAGTITHMDGMKRRQKRNTVVQV